ncbi:unnamed protein product [Bursaphelenchus xylophilus]|uniref:(pine wood nematode) hypothetical protein n=1 Tax=Bursaphelenchus xylophilus TaxID=6326 RepID=A0A1I7RMM7_BURXY|nr:unnamed protein product [Bursaphelenchus xylophilus]CAG9125662.1 unnamed protein product [Bursaphelenchus xylophilus]
MEMQILLIFVFLFLLLTDFVDGFYYLMPVCDRLTPGMKVRFYARVIRPTWIIQFHANREKQCSNELMNLETDRPFHVNHYFVHPVDPSLDHEYTFAAGTSDAWDFYIHRPMGPLQRGQLFQADIVVIEGGYEYWVDGRYIATVRSPYSYEKVDCVLATDDAIVYNQWIEGQPNCTYRSNDTARNRTTTSAPTTAYPTTQCNCVCPTTTLAPITPTTSGTTITLAPITPSTVTTTSTTTTTPTTTSTTTSTTQSSTTSTTTSTTPTTTTTTPTTTTTTVAPKWQCPYPPYAQILEGQVYDNCTAPTGGTPPLSCPGLPGTIVQQGQVVPQGCLG